MFDKVENNSIASKRVNYFFVFISMFIITEIGRKIYRPYIYDNDIFDFWIADTIGNFTGTIAIIFFDLLFINPAFKKGRIFILLITIGLIAYELIQAILPGRNTCDWRDIVATIIAGAISYFIFVKICKRIDEKEIQKSSSS
jgi:hypothetical protein